jgi:hypothetical protein
LAAIGMLQFSEFRQPQRLETSQYPIEDHLKLPQRVGSCYNRMAGETFYITRELRKLSREPADFPLVK